MLGNKRYEWTKNFPNGDSYKGEAVAGNIRDGVGEYVWAANRATYKGTWAADHPHGKGKMSVPGDPDGYEYEGDFENGLRSGGGVCRFSNGRTYTGEWKADEMHGRGTLTGSPDLDNFVEYSGLFAHGIRHGAEGRCLYKNGDVYEGQWKDGKRHGVGELQLESGAQAGDDGHSAMLGIGSERPVRYKGKFVADEPMSTNDAELTYADGSSYRGGCNRLRREGEGEHRLANGDVYRGAFRQDLRHGRGLLQCTDGRTYEGTWNHGVLDGRATFKLNSTGKGSQPSDGAPLTITFYTGPCVCGEFTGVGARATFSDGSVYSGEMRNGQPTGSGILENQRIALPSSTFGTDVMLTRYDGNFFAGKPDGEGTGSFQVPVPQSALSGDCEDAVPHGCKGMRLNYRRNGKYTGKWSQGLPHGSGTWRWDAGDNFRGEVAQGVVQGNGSYKSAQEQYEGNFSNGQPNGHGTYKHFILNETFEGAWVNGLFEGEGTWVCEKDKRTYSGTWKGGKMHGHGVDTVSGAERYEGDFISGKRHGQGVFRSSDGRVYEGQFADNEMTGTGKMLLPDGTVIEGDMERGLPHGIAHVRFPQGLSFQGPYEHGRVRSGGVGEIFFPMGDRYNGEVESATDDTDGLTPQPHGSGTHIFVEGNKLSCKWQHGVLHGEGMYTTSTGDVVARHYAEGVLLTKAAKTANPFTPENEFPNPQSEAVLKEKKQSASRPFKFVRKGDVRRASNGMGTEPAISTTSSTTKQAADTSHPVAVLPSPTMRRTAAGSGDKTTGGNACQSSCTKVIERARSPALTSRTDSLPRGSLGDAPDGVTYTDSHARSANAATDSRSGIGSRSGRMSAVRKTGSGSTTRAARSSLCTSSSVSSRLEGKAYTSRGARAADQSTRGVSSTGPTRQYEAGEESIMAPMAPLKPIAPVRRKLSGTLKDFVEQASAIRSSKEDEIHYLTEEVRLLNEKVWQLRFSIEDRTTKQTDANLKSMLQERRDAVEKLRYLLMDSADIPVTSPRQAKQDREKGGKAMYSSPS